MTFDFQRCIFNYNYFQTLTLNVWGIIRVTSFVHSLVWATLVIDILLFMCGHQAVDTEYCALYTLH